MNVKLVPVLLLLIAAPAACRSTSISSEPSAPTTAAVQPQVVPSANSVPPGTLLSVRLNERIGTEANQVGDRFTGTLTTDVVSTTGQVVVPDASRTLTRPVMSATRLPFEFSSRLLPSRGCHTRWPPRWCVPMREPIPTKGVRLPEQGSEL